MEGDAMRVALEAIGAEFPGWYAWRGVAGVMYARRPNSSPQITVRAHNLTVLRIRVAKKHEALHAEGRIP
jgi:hypothetical protein